MNVKKMFQAELNSLLGDGTECYELVSQEESSAILHSNLTKEQLHIRIHTELMDAYQEAFGEPCMAIKEMYEERISDYLYLLIDQCGIVMDISFHTDEYPYDCMVDINEWFEDKYYVESIDVDLVSRSQQEKIKTVFDWMKTWVLDQPTHRLYAVTGEIKWYFGEANSKLLEKTN